MSPLALVWIVSAVAGAALFASGWLFGRAAGRRAVLAAPQGPLRGDEGAVPRAMEAANGERRNGRHGSAVPRAMEAAQRQETVLSALAAEAGPSSPARDLIEEPRREPAGAPTPAAPQATESTPAAPPNPQGTIDLDISDLSVAEDFAASTLDDGGDEHEAGDDETRVIEAFAEPSRPTLPPLGAPPTPPAPKPARRPQTTRRPTMPVNLTAEDTREGELARLLGELEADGVKRQLVLADEVGLPVAAWRAEGTAEVMAAMAAYSSEVGERFESLLAVGRARAVTIVCDDCFLEVRPFSAGQELYHVAALGPALPAPDLFLGIQARLVQALARQRAGSQ